MDNVAWACHFRKIRPAERGRFYRPGARPNLPIYLEPQNAARLAAAARKRGEDLGVLVNRLLKRDVELAEVLR
jgi:hypothetical protein